MRCRGALLLLLAAAKAFAGAAYVSDELVLGVYTGENGQGSKLATLHSGASVETLSVNGEYTQVRLGDGTTGWVKSVYLTTQVPATLRVKQLEEELDRSRATTPALAEAAARSEVAQLKQELSAKQAALEAATRGAASPAAVALEASSGSASASLMAHISAAAVERPWLLVLPLFAALGCGFWLGYAMLAQRIKRKFGGIKVY